MVCQGSLDNVLGTVRAADLLSVAMKNSPITLRSLLKEPLFVPDSMGIFKLLEAPIFHVHGADHEVLALGPPIPLEHRQDFKQALYIATVSFSNIRNTQQDDHKVTTHPANTKSTQHNSITIQ